METQENIFLFVPNLIGKHSCIIGLSFHGYISNDAVAVFEVIACHSVPFYFETISDIFRFPLLTI